MKLILDSSDFTRIVEKSQYNDNYYKFKNNTCCDLDELREICREDWDDYEFHFKRTNSDIWEFLGFSENGIAENKEIEIDFLNYWT